MRLTTGSTGAMIMAVVAQMAGMRVAVAGGPAERLTVYLVDRVNVDAGILSSAKSQAKTILATAGVEVTWRNGPGSETFDGSIQIEIIAHTPAETLAVQPKAMARAMVVEGSRIEVFWSRVRRYSRTETVLAYVLAHEITHLLQGLSRHARTGVMKADWDGFDFAAMQPEATQPSRRPLGYERLDVQLIRQGMADRRERAAREGSERKGVLAVARF